MLVNENLHKLRQLRGQVESFQAQMKEAAKEIVKEGSKAVFDEYGDIVHQFGWAQYTPYFNDGDPCEFGMNELCIIGVEDLKDAAADHGHLYNIASVIRENDWNYDGGSWSFSRYDARSKLKTDERYAAASEACEIVYGALALNDLSKEVFGDHVIVTITRDGVDVEEYDHE